MWNHYQRLWDKITEFLSRPKWMELSAECLESFLGYPLTDEHMLDEITILKLYEWFVWDYTLGDGSRVYDHFIASLDDISESDLQILYRWGEEAIRVVQVKTIEDKQVELTSLLTGDELAAPIWDDSVEEGDIFLGRWLPLGELYIPTPSLSQVPTDVYVFLHKRIESTFSRYRSDLDDFMREYGYQLEQWAHELSGAYQQSGALLFEVLDYREALRLLGKLPGMQSNNDGVISLYGPLEYVWQHEKGKAEITIDSGEMLVSSASPRMLEKAKHYFSYQLCLEFLEEYPSVRTSETSWPQLIESLKWPRPRDKQVAELIGKKMEASYPDQIVNAIRMWNDYCFLQTPSYRKPETWAAAVEFAQREIDASHVTKGELEHKYAVSATTISDKYRQLKKSLELVLGDHRYSSL